NDSGKPLAIAEWQKSERITVVSTDRRNRSVARNAGAAIAKGQYLHFLDDDDWMLPGAFQRFKDLSEENGKAGWLYGAIRFVNNTGQKIVDNHPDEVNNCFIQLIAWEWLPLQASIIKVEAFLSVGGFAPLESLGGGFEDIDLSRQIALRYDFARINEVVACIRIGHEGSTTNYDDIVFQNRQSREKVLNDRATLARMIDSAHLNSTRPGYWHGKIVYYYLASVKWNLRKRRVHPALSRGVSALIGCSVAGRHIISADFWQGVTRPHYPRMAIALKDSGADHLYDGARSKIEALNRF
ncbi:MAG: glycosyltransferase, partial [Chloroflexota bacterium]